MHIPVLKKEVLEYLRPERDENFIDCTVNGGGHSLAILERTGPNGKALGIDLDEEIISNTRFKIRNTKYKDRLILVRGNYKNLKDIAEKNNFNNVSGILFDLGMSSWHIDESRRGFTFQKEEPLDMRYGGEKPESAADIVNNFPQDGLEKIFREYGEERFSKIIARKIVEARKIKPLKTTLDLARIVAGSEGKWQKIRAAARIFQALRIAVNDELGNIEKALPEALEMLEPQGRLVVISFHSLEDRIVKKFFNEKNKEGALSILTKKPVRPDFEEIKNNSRARSAKMRAAQKTI